MNLLTAQKINTIQKAKDVSDYMSEHYEDYIEGDGNCDGLLRQIKELRAGFDTLLQEYGNNFIVSKNQSISIKVKLLEKSKFFDSENKMEFMVETNAGTKYKFYLFCPWVPLELMYWKPFSYLTIRGICGEKTKDFIFLHNVIVDE